MKEGNSPPFIAAPTRQQQADLQQAKKALSLAQRRLRDAEPEIAAAQQKWEATVDRSGLADWEPDDGLVAAFSLEKDEPAGTKLCDGVIGKGLKFDGHGLVDAGDVGNFGYFDKFTLTAWIRPDDQQGARSFRG